MTNHRSNALRRVSLVLVGGTLSLLVACGGSTSSPSSTPDASAATPPAPHAPSGATGECHKPLETFICSATSGPPGWCCPASFDGGVATLPACSGLGERQSHGTCDAASILVREFGTHGIQCYYATATSALVGVSKRDDIPDRCGATSTTGGEIPSTTGCSLDALTPSCPPSADAGADAK
ncbi:hypothetical protein BH11MYX4_BH11MYX4_06060 [soil metagenome]